MIHCIVLTILQYYFCASWLHQNSSILPSYFVLHFIFKLEDNLFSALLFPWLIKTRFVMALIPLQQILYMVINMFGTSNHNTYRIVRIVMHIISAPKYRDNILSRGPWEFPFLVLIGNRNRAITVSLQEITFLTKSYCTYMIALCLALIARTRYVM